MSRIEKAFCVFYMVYMIVYIPCFILLADRYLDIIFRFHIFGMLIGIPLLVIVFHDIYKRDFPKPNTKVTWTLLICLLGPSIFVYIFKHGFKPREQIDRGVGPAIALNSCPADAAEKDGHDEG